MLWLFLFSITTLAQNAVPEPSPSPPPPRRRAEVQAVLAQAPAPAPGPLRPLNIVLLADEKDHGPDAHDYPLWQRRWKLLLGGKNADTTERQVNLYGPPAGGDRLTDGAPSVTVTTAWKWPSRDQLQKADLILMYCYRSGGGHWLWDEHSPKDLEAYLARGGGFVVIHAGTYLHVDMTLPAWRPIVDLTGLAFGQGNRTRRGPLEINLATGQPICRGLPQVLHLIDEPFWPAHGDQEAVQVLGTSEETIAPKSAAVKPTPMFWTWQRGRGRVFGCVPGHFTWTFDDPYLRLILLRGAAWAAGESPYRFDALALRGAAVVD